MQQRSSEILQQAKCIVKDVNFQVTNCSFRYKTLYFNELS